MKTAKKLIWLKAPKVYKEYFGEREENLKDLSKSFNKICKNS